jgi:hypothetical protein
MESSNFIMFYKTCLDIVTREFRIRNVRKYILLLFISILQSCSTSKELVSIDLKKGQDSLLKSHTILIIKARKEAEHYARFSYYSNYTTLIEEVKKDLQGRGYKVLASQVPVFSTASRDDIRALAARYGADRVLLLNERYSRDSNINILAVTYVTIIGMYFFPGNSMRATCTIEADLINPDTGESVRQVLGIASSHKYVYRIGNADSALYASHLESMKKAKDLLIDDLGKPAPAGGGGVK